MRVAASLRNRVASAHFVLQRLANASPADRVAKALTTLGRVVKTIYILRYIHEEDLRRRVQLQLNRGESRGKTIPRPVQFMRSIRRTRQLRCVILGAGAMWCQTNQP